MNIVCNSIGHQPTGQPVTTGVPNSEYEERKKGKPRIGQQATGHRPQAKRPLVPNTKTETKEKHRGE
jgi:hypothetical protein